MLNKSNLKKMASFLLVFVFCLSTMVFVNVQEVQAAGTTYYVSSSSGNDNNNGTSSSTPWKTLSKASRAYVAGDQILLKCGDTWTDEKLNVSGDGTSTNPILLSSYGTGDKPVLRRTSVGNGQICVEITNPSGWKITNLKFDTGLFGVYLHWDGDYNNDYIWVENCEFYNFDGQDYTYGFPCGLWFKILNGDTTKTYCSNITVKNCYFQDCLNGVDVYAFNSGLSFLASYLPYSNVEIYNCYGYSCGSTPVGVANTTGGSIHDNIFVGNGDHYNSTGSCAGFLMWAKNFTVERNEYAYSKRIGSDPDGCAFDFEAKCDNVSFQNNFIHDTDGTGVYLYDNGGTGGNTNMHIVNNLFSNDGLNPPDSARRNEICYGAGSHTGNIDNNIFYLAPGVPAYNNTTGFTLSGNVQTDFSEANGTNLATSATATASSSSTGYEATKVNDNNTGTSWKSASGTSTGEWVELDWASAQTINKIVVQQASGSSITRYVVQYWDSSSSTWKDAFNGLNLETSGSKIMPIKEISTTKIRFYVYSTGTGSPSLNEIYVYDIDHSGWTKINNNNAGITYSGTWTYQGGMSGYGFSGYYNDDAHYSNTPGDFAQYTFTGTGIQWIGAMNNNHGKGDVYIDGTFQTTVDTYSANFMQPLVLYQITGLTNTSHTIKVVVNSTKNVGSSNYYLDVDAFSYNSGAAAIIVDNADSSGIGVTGSWTTATGQGYNNSVLFRSGGGTGSNYVTFTPNITTAGNYSVYARWSAYTNRVTNAPFTVYYNGGNQTITENQQLNGDTWVLLGTWNFAAGTGGYVKLSDNCSAGDVIADAVKFEKQ